MADWNGLNELNLVVTVSTEVVFLSLRITRTDGITSIIRILFKCEALCRSNAPLNVHSRRFRLLSLLEKLAQVQMTVRIMLVDLNSLIPLVLLSAAQAMRRNAFQIGKEMEGHIVPAKLSERLVETIHSAQVVPVRKMRVLKRKDVVSKSISDGISDFGSCFANMHLQRRLPPRQQLRLRRLQRLLISLQ
jgi:hypothetical protein